MDMGFCIFMAGIFRFETFGEDLQDSGLLLRGGSVNMGFCICMAGIFRFESFGKDLQDATWGFLLCLCNDII